MSFESCLEHVFKVEGILSDNPLDHGGVTKYGITLPTLEAWRGQKLFSSEIEKLTLEEAAKIYKARYWSTMRLDRLRSEKLALILFDQGVNRGPATAIKMLQATLNEHFAEKLAVDGVLGNQTEVAIDTASEARLCRKLIQHAQREYVRIAKKDPLQMVFLEGWLNRTFALQDATA